MPISVVVPAILTYALTNFSDKVFLQYLILFFIKNKYIFLIKQTILVILKKLQVTQASALLTQNDYLRLPIL